MSPTLATSGFASVSAVALANTGMLRLFTALLHISSFTTSGSGIRNEPQLSSKMAHPQGAPIMEPRVCCGFSE